MDMKIYRKNQILCAGFVLSAVFFLSACGGGGGGDGAAPVVLPAGGGGNPPTNTVKFDPAAAAQLNTETGVAPNASDSVVASDAAGNAIAVWIQPDGARNNVFARRFNAASGVLEGQKFIGIASGGGARDVRLKVHPNGDAVAVWTRSDTEDLNAEDEVAASVYDHTTDVWTAKRLTSNSEKPDIRDSNRPDVAFGADGSIVAVWRERFNEDDDRFCLMSATFNPANRQWSGLQAVTPGVPTAFVDRIEHRVAVLPNKDVVVAAVSRITEDLSTVIELFRRNQATDTWGKGNIDDSGELTSVLSGLPAGRMDMLDLAANEAGQVQIVWRHAFDEIPGGRRAIATAFLNTGTKTWVVPGQVDFTAPDADSFGDKFGVTGKDSLQPKIAMDKTGKSTIVWRQAQASTGTGKQFHDIYATQFNVATGAFDGQPQLLESKPEVTNGEPGVSVDTAGNVFAIWAQETSKVGNQSIYSLFASRLNLATKAWSDAALVEAEGGSSVAVGSASIAMAPDGTALALWTQDKRIMFNRFK
jgi:hypothetical protein